MQNSINWLALIVLLPAIFIPLVFGLIVLGKYVYYYLDYILGIEKEAFATLLEVSYVNTKFGLINKTFFKTPNGMGYYYIESSNWLKINSTYKTKYRIGIFSKEIFIDGVYEYDLYHTHLYNRIRKVGL